jgi:hypothetical protein
MTTVLGTRSNYLPVKYTSGWPRLRLALNVYFGVSTGIVWGPCCQRTVMRLLSLCRFTFVVQVYFLLSELAFRYGEG